MELKLELLRLTILSNNNDVNPWIKFILVLLVGLILILSGYSPHNHNLP